MAARRVLDDNRQDSDFELREAYPLMDAAARAAGWDEDLYDDLDPLLTT